jgi:hypothetical protein
MKPLYSLSCCQEQDRDLDFPFLLICLAYRTDSIQEDTANAEAYIVVCVGRIVVVTIRNGAVVGIVVPATAAFHTVGTACWSLPQIDCVSPKELAKPIKPILLLLLW